MIFGSRIWKKFRKHHLRASHQRTDIRARQLRNAIPRRPAHGQTLSDNSCTESEIQVQASNHHDTYQPTPQRIRDSRTHKRRWTQRSSPDKCWHICEHQHRANATMRHHRQFNCVVRQHQLLRLHRPHSKHHPNPRPQNSPTIHPHPHPQTKTKPINRIAKFDRR